MTTYTNPNNEAPKMVDFRSDGMTEYDSGITITPRMSHSQADDSNFVYYSGYRTEPEVIVYDEISTYKDLSEAERYANAGYLVIASIKSFNPTQALYRLNEIASFKDSDYPLYDNLCKAIRGIISQAFIHNRGGNQNANLVHLPIFEVVVMDEELCNIAQDKRFLEFEETLIRGSSDNILSYHKAQKRFTSELVESGFNQEKVDDMVQYWSPFSFADFLKSQDD